MPGLNRSDEARHRAEGELRSAHAFLDAVVEHIPVMIFVKDADRLAFERFNRAGETLLGWPREALLGKTDHDFFPEAQARHFQEKDREVLRAGTLVDIPEERVETRTGPRWLHTMKVPLRSERLDEMCVQELQQFWCV